MDLEKYRDELNSFNTRLQNADRMIKERTVLNVFNFRNFREEFRKIKNPRDRLLCIERMIHANTLQANEQTLNITNILNEMK